MAGLFSTFEQLTYRGEATGARARLVGDRGHGGELQHDQQLLHLLLVDSTVTIDVDQICQLRKERLLLFVSS